MAPDDVVALMMEISFGLGPRDGLRTENGLFVDVIGVTVLKEIDSCERG